MKARSTALIALLAASVDARVGDERELQQPTATTTSAYNIGGALSWAQQKANELFEKAKEESAKAQVQEAQEAAAAAAQQAQQQAQAAAAAAQAAAAAAAAEAQAQAAAAAAAAVNNPGAPTLGGGGSGVYSVINGVAAPGSNGEVPYWAYDEGAGFRLRAVFNNEFLKAWVLLDQGDDKTSAVWTVYVHAVIPWICPQTGSEPVELLWHVNERPIGGSLGEGPPSSSTPWEGTPDQWCVTTGGHWDPTFGCGGLSQFQNTPSCPAVKVCDPEYDLTSCEMGDLTGKHGLLSTASQTLSYYEDPYITNIENMVGLSINFSCASGQPPVVACANLLPDAPPPGFA